MAWNFRRRVKIAPGVHLNFSKSGASTSIGPKGAKITFGKNGTYMNTSIPGTGLYSRQKIGGSKNESSNVNNDEDYNDNVFLKCFVVVVCFVFFALGCVLATTSNVLAIFTGLISFVAGITIFYKTFLEEKEYNTEEKSSVIEEMNESSEENISNAQKDSQNILLPKASVEEQKKFLGIYDPLLENAVYCLIQSGNASTSLIQRKFSIGYNRAGRIMDQLEKIGVVGPANYPSPRELQVNNTDEWLILKSRLLVEFARQMQNEDTNLTEVPKMEQSIQLTKDRFNLIKSASVNLCDFMVKVCRKKNVRSKLDEIFQLEDLDGKQWEISKKIKLIIITDVYRCYVGLGHDFSKDDDEENIGLYLFMSKYLKPDIDITYVTYNKCKQALKDSFVSLLETSELVNKASRMSPNEFFLQKALCECDRELQTQYMSLLYRFASAVAKADGQVNETEERWLSEIMKSKDINVENETNVKTIKKQEQDSVESPYGMLEELIGLSSVKDEITKLANFIKIQQVRNSKGMKTPELSYHCVFTGNPGTGKTTVARIMAGIYKDLGILKKGHLVETDRSGLVAEYVGQTAVKTNKIIDSALDGVLFIDEAYSLVQGAKEDFGQEAISTLLKRMEDDRNRLVVILAGYGSEMKTFIDSNPGLQSRFNRYIHFPDYTANELEQVFLLNAKKNQYALDDEALVKLEEIMSAAVEHKDKNFGNARFVRNLFEKTIQNQAMRLASLPNITEEVLSKLVFEDLS